MTNHFDPQNLHVFSLAGIADWQLDYHHSPVDLPALQRGFVWKVNQIESLWDSLLRGFPVGSFLLSKSADGKLFLLDGQQRATSITIGFYNPWLNKEHEDEKFWSLKEVPVVWIDLNARQKASSHKNVLRVVTKSHPWGYQRVNHNSVLSVSDRKNALKIFHEIKGNEGLSYIKLPLSKTFPYDADLPVPLSFLIRSVTLAGANWKEKLLHLCKDHLPAGIRTRYMADESKSYFDALEEVLGQESFGSELYAAVSKLERMRIPGIVVDQEVLNAEEEQGGEDPTLFVRLNSSGTRIGGDELIYSIYKASFPEAKQLVENIGANFVAPSLVISLIVRLAHSEINGNRYPYPISVNDFRKRIKEELFKNKLKEFIGEQAYSPAAVLFSNALALLHSADRFQVPPVVVKKIVKDNPDLFLMLLQWLRLHTNGINTETSRQIVTAVTALAWFGRDNPRYVREVWNSIGEETFWSRQALGAPFVGRHDFIMYPLIRPSLLRAYLLENVAENNMLWHELYPTVDSTISTTYRSILKFPEGQEDKLDGAMRAIWDNFLNRLFWCRPMVLFAQRTFINERFAEFNQMESLEDTNTPWDWDHIFPSEWIYSLRNIHQNTRRWNNCIGNLRAETLEKNRRESNRVTPAERLYNKEVHTESFIKESDWEFWKEIKDKFKEDNHPMVKIHLSAIVHRLCNIYEDWYEALNVGHLFDYEPDNK